MKETKQGLASAEARAAMHELMGAFEAFKAANDERLEAIERKACDGLLEEKVARIDQAVGAAQDRLERLSAEARRPVVGGASERDPSTASRGMDGSASPFLGGPPPPCCAAGRRRKRRSRDTCGRARPPG